MPCGINELGFVLYCNIFHLVADKPTYELLISKLTCEYSVLHTSFGVCGCYYAQKVLVLTWSGSLFGLLFDRTSYLMK